MGNARIFEHRYESTAPSRGTLSSKDGSEKLLFSDRLLQRGIQESDKMNR
jgi:hypothetical protein